MMQQNHGCGGGEDTDMANAIGHSDEDAAKEIPREADPEISVGR